MTLIGREPQVVIEKIWIWLLAKLILACVARRHNQRTGYSWFYSHVYSLCANVLLGYEQNLNRNVQGAKVGA